MPLLRKIRNHGVKSSMKIGKVLLTRWYLRLRSDRHFVNIAGIRRELLGEKLLKTSDGKILYGPFKGMKLASTSWSARDVGSIILGEYERLVVDAIMESPRSYSTFVDIGAADGIYAVGCSLSHKFSSSYCFESSEASQMSIRKNAVANNVETCITILGTARSDFLSTLTRSYSVDLSKTLFLIDIEGGEFDLLTEENLKLMRNSIVIVEIHKDVEGFNSKYETLRRHSSNLFHLSELTSRTNLKNDFKEINSWPDEDRQIIFSEGRRYQMSWLVLTPKLEHE
jgi:hypothetical protein